ncbi:MAG: DUF3990 domain-containing protein [Bacteroidales bacterium]|nr:DUF3990 domain-containing protein [Bacteroidales bacterium]
MITVFHGSFREVSKPLVALSRPNLDFGQGFYITDLQQQAERWASRMATRRFAQPVLNVYDFDVDAAKKEYRYLKFESYDKAWLDFIVANRKGKMLWKNYDVVEGGVANDNVIDTVEDYMRGRMSAEAALMELSKHQPNNQFCILKQEIIDRYLRFVESTNL